MRFSFSKLRVLDYKIDLKIIRQGHEPALPIPPSPNIPDLETCRLYSGQCLFEGTILSEGRGTTTPFKLVGAPFLSWRDLQAIKKRVEKTIRNDSLCNAIVLRPLFFKPQFDKWKDDICGGFHLMPSGKTFHALLFSLVLIRTIAEEKSEHNIWRRGKYEFGNEWDAITQLVGDRLILDYLKGQLDHPTLLDYLRTEEGRWLKEVKNLPWCPNKIYSLLAES